MSGGEVQSARDLDIGGAPVVHAPSTAPSTSQGSVVNTGQNTTCQGNLSFQDLNQDFLVEAAEVGAPIGCG